MDEFGVSEKLHISRPIIVEGKYDKIKLQSILDARIITTDGFGIFREKEKTALIRKLAENGGVIILTDSDGAGMVIRNYFNSVLGKANVIHLYIPQTAGKERRKKSPSKEGFLGVEGTDAEIIRKIFRPYADTGKGPVNCGRAITKADFYEDGLSGSDKSAERRAELAKKLGFPANMSANALLDALNLLYTYKEYKDLIKGIIDE